MTHISILKVEKEISEFKEKYKGKLVFIDMCNGIKLWKLLRFKQLSRYESKNIPQLRKLCK